MNAHLFITVNNMDGEATEIRILYDTFMVIMYEGERQGRLVLVRTKSRAPRSSRFFVDMGGAAVFLVSPKEDSVHAVTYADNMKRQSNIRATWEQVYLGARGELSFARLLGEKHLKYCLEHLFRSDASLDDYRFDLPGRIDVKTTESRNRNLVVNRIHPDVRYVLLRATRDVVIDRFDPLELTFEVMGWSTGDKARFSPFRADPKKSFQLAGDLLPISTLLLDIVKSNLADRNTVL